MIQKKRKVIALCVYVLGTAIPMTEPFARLHGIVFDGVV